MEIIKTKTMQVKLNKADLKEAIKLFLNKNNVDCKNVIGVKDYKRSEYEPMGNTEGETYYYFDGIEATVEV